MSCLICGETETIKSHLIPRSFAREVQSGKAHAVAHGENDFEYTQSGLYETTILCGECDNKLGALENYAIKAFRKIRKSAQFLPVGEYILQDIYGDDILRFIAGILWKYSVASTANGKIELGPFKDTLRDIAFSKSKPHGSIDAILIRLKRGHGDDGVFAYRTPYPDRILGFNGYRILLGGVFIFAKIDNRTLNNKGLKFASIRGKIHLPYVVMPAEEFEEYTKPRSMMRSNGRLSKFLDKQENK